MSNPYWHTVVYSSRPAKKVDRKLFEPLTVAEIGNIRLRNEALALKENPSPRVTAWPLKNNLREWHANIRQSPKGPIVHMIVKFPASFPQVFPNVFISTCYLRTNTDILRSYKKVKVANGWMVCINPYPYIQEIAPPMYKVEESVVRYLERFVRFIFKTPTYFNVSSPKARNFKCPSCRHCSKNSIWPSFIPNPKPTRKLHLFDPRRQNKNRHGSNSIKELDVLDVKDYLLNYNPFKLDGFKKPAQKKIASKKNRNKQAHSKQRSKKSQEGDVWDVIEFDSGFEEQETTDTKHDNARTKKLQSAKTIHQKNVQSPLPSQRLDLRDQHTTIKPNRITGSRKGTPNSRTIQQKQRRTKQPERRVACGLEDSIFGSLPDEIICIIFSFLYPPNIITMRYVCNDFARIGGEKSVWWNILQDEFPGQQGFYGHLWLQAISQRAKEASKLLTCGWTWSSCKRSSLGHGVKIQRKNLSHGCYTIRCLSRPGLMSMISLAEEVTITPFNDEFDTWIPIWINSSHGLRALPTIDKAIGIMYQKQMEKGKFSFNVAENPKIAVPVIASLLHGSVSKSILDFGYLENLHMYFNVHRLLLLYAQRFPEFISDIRDRYHKFITDKDHRENLIVLEFYELFHLHTVAIDVQEGSWNDMLWPFLNEIIRLLVTRTKKVNFRKHKKSGGFEDEILEDVLSTGLPTKTTGLIKMFAMTCWFVKYICWRKGRSILMLAKCRDIFNCLPSREMYAEYRKADDAVREIKSWEDFFNFIGVIAPSKEDLVYWFMDHFNKA